MERALARFTKWKGSQRAESQRVRVRGRDEKSVGKMEQELVGREKTRSGGWKGRWQGSQNGTGVGG